MGGEVGAVAVVVATADEEDLYASLAGGLVGGDDVGVGEAGRVDHGGALDVGEAADTVADGGGALEFEVFCRQLHLAGEFLLDVAGLAAEEGFGLGDVVAVFGGIDPADARGGAALDLVQQAGAGAVGENGVLAGAEQEHALHGGDGLVDGPGGGEGAVIAAFAGAGAAVLGDLREGVVFGQHQPRVALVVAQDDVEAGLEPLDEVGFEQEGFGFGVGGDDLHRDGLVHHAPQPLGQADDLGVVGDALPEVAGLADVERLAAGVEHAVDAGALRHGGEGPLDYPDPGECGRCGCGLWFVHGGD